MSYFAQILSPIVYLTLILNPALDGKVPTFHHNFKTNGNALNMKKQLNKCLDPIVYLHSCCNLNDKNSRQKIQGEGLFRPRLA